MRHINDFPVFTVHALDELRLKIVHGVEMETFTASDPIHRQDAAGRFDAWVAYPCWLPGSRWEDGKGFKKFKFKGHTLYIHRAAYECFTGPVPKGQLVDHLCRVRGCCQPMHLEAVPAKVNIERGANRNHLMRNGALPPVMETAKSINPNFFQEPTVGELSSEFFRRYDAQCDITRQWDTYNQGPLPDAPAGFAWEATPCEGICVLNPIRAMATIPQVTVVDMDKYPITQPAPLRYDALPLCHEGDRILTQEVAWPRDYVYEESRVVANGYVPHHSAGYTLRQFLLFVGEYASELSRYFWWRMSGRTSVW